MKKQTAGRENLGELAPKFAELNDDVLFGEVWSREDKMSLRDRSMITISALTAQGLYPQLKSHFILGKKHGVTKQEAVEIVTQLAFVTFEPKCRNNWHIHHATSGGGQLLICVDGEEWYQEEGKEAVSLKPDYQNSFLVR